MQQRKQALEYKEEIFLESSYQEEKNVNGSFQCAFLGCITLQPSDETMQQ